MINKIRNVCYATFFASSGFYNDIMLSFYKILFQTNCNITKIKCMFDTFEEFCLMQYITLDYRSEYFMSYIKYSYSCNFVFNQIAS